MKKITLLILMLFMSLAGYSQVLDENFDAVTAPALPAGWLAFNNGAGAARPWATYATSFASAPNSVTSLRYNPGPTGTSEDWLATPLFAVPANGQLQFNTRKQSSGSLPTTYRVMVAPATANPALASSYAPLNTFTDADITATFTQRTIPLAYPAGTQLYIAFVRVLTVPPGEDFQNADGRWYLDDVRVNSRCVEPITLSVNTVGMYSVNLSWVRQAGTTNTDWEVVIVEASQAFNEAARVAVNTGSTNPPTVSSTAVIPLLNPDTDYKYYVRSACSATNKSDWTAPFFFRTAGLGETCADPIVIPNIGYSTWGNTGDSADRVDTIQGGSCGAVPATTNYMAGNDVFYSFVAPTTGDVRIEMAPGGTNSSIFVYSSCATVGGTCLAGVANASSAVRVIPTLAVTAGQTYLIVLSSSAATQSYSYYLEIQYVTCAEPTNLGAVVTSQTAATLSWNTPFPAATWDYIIQPAGAGIPAEGDPGITEVTSPTDVSTFSTNVGPLVGSTSYQYWVRTLCVAGGTTYSPWAGPFEFFTPVCDPAVTQVCNYEFLLRGTAGWQGAVMHVRQNGVTVKVLGPQFTSGTSLSVPVGLCHGIPFELVWVTGGNAPQTVAITVRNSFTQQIFIKNGNAVDQPGTTPLYTKLVDCLFPECLPPTNPRMQGATTANGATLNWTPGIATTAWEVYYAPTADIVVPSNTATAGTVGEAAGLPPFPISGLISDTPYQFYVRAVCDGNKTSDWVGPVSFRTAISCAIPTTPTVVSTTTTSAILNWNQPAFGGVTPANWEVVVQPAGTGMPAYSPIPAPAPYSTNINAPYPGLTPATAYEYWVRAVCSGSDVSRWVGPVAFNTLCNPMTVPYSEGFNSTSTTELCWTVTSLAGGNRWDMNYATNPFEGNQAASMLPNNGTNNNDYLISPTLVLPAASTNEFYRLRFKYRVESATEANNIEVLISDSGIDPASFDETLMTVRTWNNVTYLERVINLNTLAGQNINVAWHLPAGLNNRNRIYIDDVVFERIPACPNPYDLIVENITSTSADLSWTPGFLETRWQVAVQPLGTGVPSATFAGDLVTDNEDFTVNRDYLGQPLLPGSQYEYYVRAYCNDTDQSQWVGPIVFRVLLCEVADRCAYTFTMTDTGSNTWQGSTMSVIQNGLTIATLTGPTNGQRTANQVVTFCPGVQFELFWNAGTSTAAASTQVGVSITNFYGDVVYNKAPGTGTLNSRLYRGMPFCAPITCPYPTDLSVTQTSGTSVSLNWTPGGTETAWDYVFQPAGGNYPSVAPGTGVRVNGNPTASILSINAATPYEYYVRAVCGPDDISYWSGPYIFTIYNSPGCIGVEIEGVEISVGSEILVCPNDLCVDLSATYFQTQATTTYTVESIPYLPPYPFTGGTPIPIGTDDDWTDTITLPFNFCFFGQTFNKLLITDNGALSFSIAGVVPGGRYTPLGEAGFAYNQQVPYNPGGAAIGPPYVNAVFGVLQDLYPGQSPADFSINYQVLGTAPCRAFVVSYYKAAHFSCTSDLETSQIVLYEGSNMIDIYVEDRSVCSFNSGSGLIGLQNADATVAIVPPGRNTGQWTASNEAWRFTPDGALSNVQFEWRKDGRFYSNDLNISVCITDETLMEAVALYDKCDGTFETRKSEVTLKIDYLPIEDPEDLKACIGTTSTFDLTLNNAIILDGLTNPEDYEITYYLTPEEAEAGTTGAITSHATSVLTPIYVRIKNTVTTCWETRTFNLVPDAPLPDYTLDTFDSDATICTSESTTIVATPVNFVLTDATYEWTLPDGTISPETSNILTIPVGTPEGVYVFTVKVDDGCETIKTYELTVSNADPIVDFRYDTPVCIAGPNPLVIPTGAALTTGGTFTVATVTGSGTLVFVSNTTGEIDLTQTPAGVYDVTYKIEASACTEEGEHTFRITILDVAAPATDFTYDNPTVCSNGDILTINPSAGLTTGGTFNVDHAGLVIDAATGIITVAGSTPGVYEVTYSIGVVNVGTCTGIGTGTPVTVTINAGINADATFTYPKTSYCANATSVLPDFITTPGGDFTAPAGLIINAQTGEISISTSTAGDYRITYTLDDDALTCLNGDVKFFDITIEAEIEVDVADECENGKYMLSATPNDTSYSYKWENASAVIAGETKPTLDVTAYIGTITNPVYPMEFTVTVNNGACDSTESFTVYNVSCNIPKGISPNGDGSNDEFDLTGFNVRKLEIFNRYGTQVYSRNNYVKEWRGQSDKGDDLPDGTYYYVIYRDGVKTATGWVQINRQRN